MKQFLFFNTNNQGAIVAYEVPPSGYIKRTPFILDGECQSHFSFKTEEGK